MSSNSIRVGASLFQEAQREGTIMSRSAAQQIEYWARLGAALEATGLSVADVSRMLRSANPAQESAHPASEEELWALKRQQQSRDLDSVRSGQHSAASMSWFSNGRAKNVKLVDSPY
jgi:predicted homoserine dehydrogenase-like protein